MRATRPLFEFDPGWLFIAAGLAVCAAGVLLPAQADLRVLEEQLAVLQDEEARAYQRLAAHADFIDHVDRAEPEIIKRLAAAQLNLVPEGDRPVVLAASNAAPVTSWIDSTLSTDIRPPPFDPPSTLSRWANGPSRLWLFGGGIFAVFVGLLIAPESSRRRKQAIAAPSGVSEIAFGDGVSITIAADRVDMFDEDAEVDAECAHDVMAANIAARYAHAYDVEPTLPATVDLDDRRDLRQQEDTVDLEENELPARTRTVIDDDVAWHNAATMEHASEVLVEGKEIVSISPRTDVWEADGEEEPSTADGPIGASESEIDALIAEGDDHGDAGDDWQHDEPVVAMAADPDDEMQSDDEDEQSQASEQPGNDAERVNTTAMLLDDAASVEASVEAPLRAPDDHGGIDADDSAGVEMPATKLSPATTVKQEAKRAATPKRRAKSNQAARRAKQHASDAGADEIDVSAIPFLRYRPSDHDEVDADASADGSESGDDGEAMIAMEADEGDIEIAGGDDDDSMKIGRQE